MTLGESQSLLCWTMLQYLWLVMVLESQEIVSILVVLDNALVPVSPWIGEDAQASLNPCCAGQCSSTFVAVGDRKQAIKS